MASIATESEGNDTDIDTHTTNENGIHCKEQKSTEHIRNNTATTQRRWTATQFLINWIIIHNKINYKT